MSSLRIFFLLFIRHFTAALLDPPETFLPNPYRAGGGGFRTGSSAHFQIYNAAQDQTDAALKLLESTYSCFVDTLGWRSTGLSFNAAKDDGPWYKMNVYGVPNRAAIGNADGGMSSDAKSGAAFLKIVQSTMTSAYIMAHQFGYALTYHERNWVGQTRTGAWWETLAEWASDVYETSLWCETARSRNGQYEGRTRMDFEKVVGSAHEILVDATRESGNHRQAWPFLAYLTYNPDKYPFLGKTAVRDMIRKYKTGSNETPFHALATVASPVTVQQIVGRYWARMANGDIGHPQGRMHFESVRAKLRFANLEPVVNGTFRVKADKRPKYLGANVILLKGKGRLGINLTAEQDFTATIVIRTKTGAIRYIDLPIGVGETSIAETEDAALVIANTPKSLILYDAYNIHSDDEVSVGLNYTLRLF